MTQLVLRTLNPFALLLLAALGIGIQTSLFAFWPLSYIQPDIALLVVIWCGLRRNFLEGGILTLLTAQMMEIHSAAPRGIFMVTYMLAYLIVRVTDRLLVIPDLSSFVIVTIFSSVFVKISNAIILDLLSPSAEVIRNTIFLLFPGAAIEGLLSIWGYQLFEKFDLSTFKLKRSDESLEQNLNLDSEGF